VDPSGAALRLAILETKSQCNQQAAAVAERTLPPIPQTSPTEQAPQIGRTTATPPADPCAGVAISDAPGTAASDARWCGSHGATRTTRMQAVFDRTESCRMYATKPYGNLFQNQLYSEAVRLAKAGDFEGAFERIDACQCHNPISQLKMRDQRLPMLCWLRSQ
jgi:hypothetical protein